MAEGSVMGSKVKGLYKSLCQDEWDAYTVGIIIAFLSVLMLAWSRPWGAVGAIRNWGDWIIYGMGFDPFGMFDGEAPSHVLKNSGSVIGVGFIGGAFVSACLGNNFAFRIPPVLEMVKAVIAGGLMGVGAALAGGCNVGGFYNAIGNLSAHGFAMMIGLVLGAVTGLKYLYWEMEHITWGSGGAKTIELPSALQIVLGLLAIGGLIYGAYNYSGNEDLAKMSGMLVIAAGLGYAMQRGRWCMIQGFREPHMTGDCTMAKSVALSVLLLAIGIAVVKAAGLQSPIHYVRGTFGWGGVVGGFIFALGAMFAGGCGTGTLWRVGEGQIKLWIVVPFFGISNSIMTAWFNSGDVEGQTAWAEFLSDADTDKLLVFGGKLGKFVYMPDTFLGYGGTLLLISLAMAAWFLIVKWNEDTNKFIVPM
ncbi:MAG: YeeE/YedE family protein [Proteobacteria bacterium]|nr:YeeE/YedE family protein [Pseudomonadota bacterium]MBU1737276.1 YeeE/YedE family protein [Pseudomonadota bacterium]